ncbi:conserved exported protein of unknown function [Nitrospira sp. KM1]|uniref:hypothetical protein n=1 Tax=Nitrospira sp. KM1 TaxID=1936990 RepID=UPI0013A795C4|nr:hypothetical protein [Nitrospira sp. KM1]BCA55197.1 conserved exported protein of unknown function [Nitrospira sp. KM1]
MNRSALLIPVMWLWRPKLFFLLILFVGSAYLLVAFNYSYSDGSRAGYIQKFSKKGWFCKTHEGELAMTTVPGLAPVLWDFTIWDENVATDLSKILGKRVILHYKEYRYLPTTCFGDTPYFVDRVELQE